MSAESDNKLKHEQLTAALLVEKEHPSLPRDDQTDCRDRGCQDRPVTCDSPIYPKEFIHMFDHMRATTILNTSEFVAFKQSAIKGPSGKPDFHNSQGMIVNGLEPQHLAGKTSSLSYFAAMYAGFLDLGDSGVLGLQYYAGHHREAAPTDSLYGVPGLLRSLCNQLLQRTRGLGIDLSFLNAQYLSTVQSGNVGRLCDLFRRLIVEAAKRSEVVVTCVIDGFHFLEQSHEDSFDEFITMLRKLTTDARQGQLRHTEFKYMLIHANMSDYAKPEQNNVIENRILVLPITGITRRAYDPGLKIASPHNKAQFVPGPYVAGNVATTDLDIHTDGSIFEGEKPDKALSRLDVNVERVGLQRREGSPGSSSGSGTPAASSTPRAATAQGMGRGEGAFPGPSQTSAAAGNAETPRALTPPRGRSRTRDTAGSSRNPSVSPIFSQSRERRGDRDADAPRAAPPPRSRSRTRDATGSSRNRSVSPISPQSRERRGDRDDSPTLGNRR